MLRVVEVEEEDLSIISVLFALIQLHDFLSTALAQWEMWLEKPY